MSRSLNQTLKLSISRSKQTKITFTAPVNVQNLVEEYLEYYSDLEGERILLDLLISNILESALNNEKDFQKWRRNNDSQKPQKKVTDESKTTPPLPLK
jgi:hypothetical protein